MPDYRPESRYPVIFHVAAWMIVITLGIFWFKEIAEGAVKFISHMAESSAKPSATQRSVP